MHIRHTFSFCSVSSLSEADSDSRVSPFTAGDGVVAFTDPLRTPGALCEAEARAFAAERAVAPLAMEDEGEVELESEGGDRREAGVGRAGAAVAIMGYRYRDEILRSSRARWTAQPSSVADVGGAGELAGGGGRRMVVKSITASLDLARNNHGLGA